jgi:hypothetical protein
MRMHILKATARAYSSLFVHEIIMDIVFYRRVKSIRDSSQDSIFYKEAIFIKCKSQLEQKHIYPRGKPYAH